jgi:geranylgeranylglycerol-phosphate geranylgeranyltransferase
MMRPYTLAYPGMLAVGGAVLANKGVSMRTALEVAPVTCLGWIGGLYSCDAFDKALDSIAKPSRPSPSGRVTTRSACQFMVAYAAFGLLLAAYLSPLCVVLALAMGDAAIAITFRTIWSWHGIA